MSLIRDGEILWEELVPCTTTSTASGFRGLVVSMLAFRTQVRGFKPGFDGLVVSMLASGTQVRGFKPGFGGLVVSMLASGT
jgi:hypothetical protein